MSDWFNNDYNNSNNMRKFHNRVKTNLIYDASYINRRNKIPVALLDVGVGRGGDIFKWDKCNIHEVVGYDVDQQYIDECHNRYYTANLAYKRNYKFLCCDTIDDAVNNSNCKLYDIVSCQFVIHYFFKSEDMITSLISSVAKYLKKDGKFIGTFMNGDTITKLSFTEKDGYLNFKNTAVLLSIENSTKIYGRKMDVYIADTLYFGDKSVSNEYLVSFNILLNICNKFGLKLLKLKHFEEYYKNHNNENIFTMDKDHQQCSFLYSSFEFIKL